MKDSDGHDAVWWARECREDLGLGQINYLVKSNEKWAADNLAGFPKSRAEDLDREQPGLGSSETLAARHVLGGTASSRILQHPESSCNSAPRALTAAAPQQRSVAGQGWRLCSRRYYSSQMQRLSAEYERTINIWQAATLGQNTVLCELLRRRRRCRGCMSRRSC